VRPPLPQTRGSLDVSSRAGFWELPLGSRDPLLPLRGAVATARAIRGAELLVVNGMGYSFPAQVVPLVAGAIATHTRKASV